MRTLEILLSAAIISGLMSCSRSAKGQAQNIPTDTGLSEPILSMLMQLDPKLDLNNRSVRQFTIKMLKRLDRSYTQIQQIYTESNTPTDHATRIPLMVSLLRPSSESMRQTFLQLPDGAQDRQSNMICYNTEKNFGAICGGIDAAIGNEVSHCRHTGWEIMTPQNLRWAAKLKAAKLSETDVSNLKKIKKIIDDNLQMEYHYQTNSRDYPDL